MKIYKVIPTALITAIMVSTSSFADVVVVVHPSNANSLDKSNISKVFMGKRKYFEDGTLAMPINQATTSSATSEFNAKVLKKSSSQLKAYWSKLMFTGAGIPPQEVKNDKEVLQLVSANPSMIGFIDAASVDGSVKVVGKF